MLRKISFYKIAKDVWFYSVRGWITTILLCSTFENGWIPGMIGKQKNISSSEFSSLLGLLVIISCFPMIINVLKRKYIKPYNKIQYKNLIIFV